jgi:hypothetical protein
MAARRRPEALDPSRELDSVRALAGRHGIALRIPVRIPTVLELAIIPRDARRASFHAAGRASLAAILSREADMIAQAQLNQDSWRGP